LAIHPIQQGLISMGTLFRSLGASANFGVSMTVPIVRVKSASRVKVIVAKENPFPFCPGHRLVPQVARFVTGDQAGRRRPL
jgi:hypothetical protein